MTTLHGMLFEYLHKSPTTRTVLFATDNAGQIVRDGLSMTCEVAWKPWPVNGLVWVELNYLVGIHDPQQDDWRSCVIQVNAAVNIVLIFKIFSPFFSLTNNCKLEVDYILHLSDFWVRNAVGWQQNHSMLVKLHPHASNLKVTCSKNEFEGKSDRVGWLVLPKNNREVGE